MSGRLRIVTALGLACCVTTVGAQGYAARKDLVDVPLSIWAPMSPYDTIRRQK